MRFTGCVCWVGGDHQRAGQAGGAKLLIRAGLRHNHNKKALMKEVGGGGGADWGGG